MLKIPVATWPWPCMCMIPGSNICIVWHHMHFYGAGQEKDCGNVNTCFKWTHTQAGSRLSQPHAASLISLSLWGLFSLCLLHSLRAMNCSGDKLSHIQMVFHLLHSFVYMKKDWIGKRQLFNSQFPYGITWRHYCKHSISNMATASCLATVQIRKKPNPNLM